MMIARSQCPGMMTPASAYRSFAGLLAITVTPALAVLPAICGLVAIAVPAAAQQPLRRDTVISIEPMVVIADRTETPLGSSVAAVSVLTAEQLAASPQRTLADGLRRVPGFALVDFDGLGYDPQLMVRGFYGGGVAEYVVVLLDGRPLNDVHAGLIAWDAIPLVAIERVEVVRGGTSALWGDAAVGGVINVVTRSASERSVRWHATGGSHGSWRGGAYSRLEVGGRDLSIFGGLDRTDGFRAHAERTSGRAGAAFALTSSAAGSLRLSAHAHQRRFDEPGPLSGDDVVANRTASDLFYRFDQTDDRGYRLGLEGDRAVGMGGRLSASLAGDLRDSEAVRTIALTPDFADTQERVLGTARGVATAQLAFDRTGLPVMDRIVVGVDASYATLDSKYYAVLNGDRDAYSSADGQRGDLEGSGRGSRGAAAAFAQYTLLPVAAVRISAGVRADWLSDEFTIRAPDDGETLEATHSAFSPRVGVNVQYLNGALHSGNLYMSAGRSFKAPTLDQLFDQRRLPVPFPPFAVTTSNALLEPQDGVNIEAGIFHRGALARGRLAGELSLSVYQMDMENELDFDIQSLRYVNIGRSRHRGIETGIRVEGPHASAVFLNYTRQHVTSRAGDNAGSYLKAIPRHFLTAGASAEAVGRLETGLVVSHVRGIFLDDANTLTLPAYTRVDARVSHPVAGLTLFLDVRNLFDARYSTTGFPDPGGTDAVYYHPAAGRTFDLGLRGGH